MALLDLPASRPILSTFALLVVWILTCSAYRIWFHPLSHIPGPFVASLTSLWLYYHSYIGDEASIIDSLHHTHGSLVRVSPGEIDISDPDAVEPIYVKKGGFRKAECYANFDIDAHKTIFSIEDLDARAKRAKAVVPLFSTKMLRESEGIVRTCVGRLVGRLELEKDGSKGGAGRRGNVNLLDATRRLAIDVVSSHLFSRNYDSMSEEGELSVSAFVDTFVAVGRFFYLPGWVFQLVEMGLEKCFPDQKVETSMKQVDAFVDNLVRGTKRGSGSYAARLLDAGITPSEVKAQCKDLVFAGTDSTGMNVACLMRYLILHPEKHERLRQEVAVNAALGSEAKDFAALPYLAAVVKESLRLSMANPTRLPRLVPAAGWQFKGAYFPHNTIVGCAGYSLHFNPSVFPSPREFKPERWLDGAATDEMSKSWFAFGAGSRACIARNLAMVELHTAAAKVVESGVLEGARVVADGEIPIYEWFNSRVKGERIDVVW
ncbi:cytochrome P450, partial [Lophiostoma macrostomum CBS 122681]